MSEPLEYLIQIYFHQDWDLLGSSVDEVLTRFAGENPRSDVVGARDGARALIENSMSDEDLLKNLEARGLEYSPSADGLSARDWLERVALVLSSQLEKN